MLLFMWKVSIMSNVLVMLLSWLASLQAIALTHNRFVQYPETGKAVVLPMVTTVALFLRSYSAGLPAAWMVLSVLVYGNVKNKPAADRNEFLLAYTLVTVIVGFSMLLFFNVAAKLPDYQIAAAIQ